MAPVDCLVWVDHRRAEPSAEWDRYSMPINPDRFVDHDLSMLAPTGVVDLWLAKGDVVFAASHDHEHRVATSSELTAGVRLVRGQLMLLMPPFCTAMCLVAAHQARHEREMTWTHRPNRSWPGR